MASNVPGVYKLLEKDGVGTEFSAYKDNMIRKKVTSFV